MFLGILELGNPRTTIKSLLLSMRIPVLQSLELLTSIVFRSVGVIGPDDDREATASSNKGASIHHNIDRLSASITLQYVTTLRSSFPVSALL